MGGVEGTGRDGAGWGRPLARHRNFKSKRIWLSDAEDERLRREDDRRAVLLSAVPKVKPQRGTEIKKKKKKKLKFKIGMVGGRACGRS